MYLVAEWKSRKGRDTGFQILNLLLSESQNIQWLQLIPVFSLNPFQRCSEVLGSGSVLCLISMLELHHFLYWAITHFGPSVSSSLSSHSPKSISNIHSFTEALLLLLCKYLGGGKQRIEGGPHLAVLRTCVPSNHSQGAEDGIHVDHVQGKTNTCCSMAQSNASNQIFVYLFAFSWLG